MYISEMQPSLISIPLSPQATGQILSTDIDISCILMIFRNCWEPWGERIISSIIMYHDDTEMNFAYI